MKSHSISVVVPAYNCEKTIDSCIQGLLNQKYPVSEIILVDDGSTDNTAEVIKKFSKIQYAYQKNSGPAAARNKGVAMAKGDIIFFTDSDCIASKDWIEKSIGHLEKDKVGVVAGSYGIANNNSLLARCIYREILYRHHHLMPDYPKVFGSYNFGIWRHVFVEAGRFNEAYHHASGEDNDLSYKILKAGYKIYFEPAATVKHFHPTRLSKYLVEQFRHGYWRVKMYKAHPSMMVGDDYTFWKDIVEVPLALLILCFAFLGFFGVAHLKSIAVLLTAMLYAIELYFSFVTLKKYSERIFFSFVLFLRAFARGFGLSSGICHFWNKKL